MIIVIETKEQRVRNMVNIFAFSKMKEAKTVVNLDIIHPLKKEHTLNYTNVKYK